MSVIAAALSLRSPKSLMQSLRTLPAANAFSRRVETLASLLARHPAIGRRTDLAKIRVFAARPYPYLIFYREEPDGITILRVRHMARKGDWRRGR